MKTVVMAVSGQAEEQMWMLHRTGTVLLVLSLLLLLAAAAMFFRLDILRLIRLDSGMDAKKRIRQLNREAAEKAGRPMPAAGAGNGRHRAAASGKAETATEVIGEAIRSEVIRSEAMIPETEDTEDMFATVQLQEEKRCPKQPETAGDPEAGFVMEMDLVVVHDDESAANGNRYGGSVNDG